MNPGQQLDPNHLPSELVQRQALAQELKALTQAARARGEFLTAMLHASDALLLFPNEREFLDLVDEVALSVQDPLSLVPVASGAVHVATAAARARILMMKKDMLGAIELLTEGMKKLGLLKGATKDLIKKKAYMKYYMHGVGHFLGLDVHDAGRYWADQKAKQSRTYAPGMCLTVEPGIYVPPDDKSAPAKYRGIGIRIEDDVLVTENGNVNLTSKVAKDPDEIEAIMAKSRKR